MADYYRNFDQLFDVAFPTYTTYPATAGLQVTVTDETSFVEPCTVLEFKLHGYIDTDTDDALLALYLKAARIDVENYLQKSLGIKTIQLMALRLPANYTLPLGPVASITTAGYTKLGDILIEGGESVTIEYTTNASLVNDSIKQAIYKQCFNYYENRDSNEPVALQSVTKVILNPYRAVKFP